MSESTEPCCDICGDDLRDKYVYQLPNCPHKYHYECLLKSFMCDRKRMNQCPLCSKPSGLLPIVNSLPKLVRGIHYSSQQEVPEKINEPCTVILQSGKRKGCSCGSKCMIGMSTCKRHHQSYLKAQDKLKALDKPKKTSAT